MTELLGLLKNKEILTKLILSDRIRDYRIYEGGMPATDRPMRRGILHQDCVTTRDGMPCCVCSYVIRPAIRCPTARLVEVMELYPNRTDSIIRSHVFLAGDVILKEIMLPWNDFVSILRINQLQEILSRDL